MYKVNNTNYDVFSLPFLLDFDFKTFLQQSLDIIDSELNSITFDLQNRHDQDQLFFDSDGMDEFDNEIEQQENGQPASTLIMNTTSSTQHLPNLQTLVKGSNDCFASIADFNKYSQDDIYYDSRSCSSSSVSTSSLDSTALNGPTVHSSDDEDDNSISSSLSDKQSRPSSTTPPLLSPFPPTLSTGTPTLSATFDFNNNSTSDAYDGPSPHGRHHSHQHQQQHRPPPPNTPVDIPLNLMEKRAFLDRLKSQGMTLLAPPNNRWSFEECSICCDAQWLLVRSCCSFAACLECLSRYYSSRIELGCLSIECIGSECHQLVYRAEVNARLNGEQKALYTRLLLLSSSESERAKPCPQCNTILTLSAAKERQMKQASNRLLYGTKQLLGTLGLRKSKEQRSSAGELAATVPEGQRQTAHEPSSSFVYDSLVFK